MKELFVRAGLNQTEAEVIMFLMQRGAARGSSIARGTGIKRPTVYTVLYNLERLGLIAAQRDKGVTLFSARSAQQVPAILGNRARRELGNTLEAIGLLEEEVKKIPQGPLIIPGGLEVETIRGQRDVYAWLVSNLGSCAYDSIFNPQKALVGPLKQAALELLQQSAVAQFKVREIVVGGPLAAWWRAQIVNPNHQLKEADAASQVSTDFNLCNGTVCMINYEHGDEMAILIRQKQYFTTMEGIFEMLWKRL